MSTVFISYASQDRERAREVAAVLEAHGHSVWWDRTIPPGRVFDEVIQEALTAARCVIVLWSSHSLRSNWVKVEAEEAANRGLLVPALIENVTPPIQFKRIQAANLSEWSGDDSHPEFRNLLAAIDRLLGRPASTVTPPAVARRVPTGAIRTVRTVAWSVGGTLAVVAAVWFYARTPPPADGGRQGAAVDGSDAAPPTATTAKPETPANVPPPARRGDLINLVSPENGGELISATHPDWTKTVDGNEDSELWQSATESAVFGFKDGRYATVEGVEILIRETSQYNVSEMEVSTSTTGSDGPFTSPEVVKTRNMLIANARYQRTTFTPRTARFVRVRILKAHTDSTPGLREWRLLGTLH